MLYRLFITCLISLPTGVISYAQSRLNGVVTDELKTPVAGCIIKISLGDKIIAYTITNGNGQYSITFNSNSSQVNIGAESMGYESVYRTLSTESKICNFVLKESVTVLKEVVVKAPAIYMRSDTLSYQLSGFVTRGDYTLKDAIKKLPGIDVAESGTIKYMGKDISAFYIDGLNLLGGRYGIATNNIPASYVNSVQVLNNHSDVKIDKDMFSNDVAINIKLSNKAKFKPIGKYEAKIGYGDKLLYGIGGAGMLFKHNIQGIITVKAGNMDKFADSENTDHFGSSADVSITDRLLNGLSASTPPLKIYRYISPIDRLTSVNLLKKMNNDISVKGNVGYNYSKSCYEYSLEREYYDADKNINISQQQTSVYYCHKPWFSIEYKNNSASKYVNNTTRGYFTYVTQNLSTIEENHVLSQHQLMEDYNAENDLSIKWLGRKLKWEATSFIQFISTPTGRLTVTNEDNDNIIQTANSRSFTTKNSISAIYKHRASRLYMPLYLYFSTNRLSTDLTKDTESTNNINYRKFSVFIAPRYEYTHHKRNLTLNYDLSVRGDYISSFDTGEWYISVCPRLTFNYRATARSAFEANVAYSSNLGDILVFVTSPVQINNNTLRLGSGIISHNKVFSAIIGYNFKIPLSMLFINADISYSNSNNNLLSHSKVSNKKIETGYLNIPNNSDDITCNIGVTKQFTAIATKISINGSYRCGRQLAAQNESVMDLAFQNLSLYPSINAKPCKYVEMEYSGTLSRFFTKYSGINASYLSQKHNVVLKVSPIELLQFSANLEVSKEELSKGSFKTFSLLDAGLQYKHKSLKIVFDVRNIFNCRSYSYTIYNSINTYSYNYHLRGREVILSTVFTI